MSTTQLPLYRKRVLVVDDHPVVRQGLALLISRDENLIVSLEAEDASAAMQAIAASNPDMVILDISLGGVDGITLTRNIRDRYPDIPILVLSMHDESLFAERALRAGARGYIMKNESSQKIMEALHRVLRGELYLSERLSATFLSKFLHLRSDNQDSYLSSLTDRELEVFQLIGVGRSTREIAETLHLSAKTIETHRTHIIEKLGLRNSKEVFQHAFRWTNMGE
ncbi:MAG TPA: response regulator transcription factor [Terriglobia bacterium]|nr:response regulator transcription factor [Terriglobia bacterium]